MRISADVRYHCFRRKVHLEIYDSIRFQENYKSKNQGKSLGEGFSRIYTDIQSTYEYIRVYEVVYVSISQYIGVFTHRYAKYIRVYTSISFVEVVHVSIAQYIAVYSQICTHTHTSFIDELNRGSKVHTSIYEY